MLLRVASYNVLADGYLVPGRYARVAKDVLEPSRRRAAIADRIAALDADVVCLQEIEPDALATISTRVPGYECAFARKRQGRPDGLATMVRTSRFAAEGARTLVFRDGLRGKPDSGHVALFVNVVDRATRELVLVVVDVHVRWDAPGTPPEAQIGLREIRELLDERARTSPALPCVVCGDFNATADSDVVRAMREAGFVDAYATREADATCNSNAHAKRIDYLFHTHELAAEPWPVPALHDDDVLPSRAEPSDHLPIGATIQRVAAT